MGRIDTLTLADALYDVATPYARNLESRKAAVRRFPNMGKHRTDALQVLIGRCFDIRIGQRDRRGRKIVRTVFCKCIAVPDETTVVARTEAGFIVRVPRDVASWARDI